MWNGNRRILSSAIAPFDTLNPRFPLDSADESDSDSRSSYLEHRTTHVTKVLPRIASVDSFPESASPLQYWSLKRHLTRNRLAQSGRLSHDRFPWHLRDKVRTGNAALFLCLNIGVDPPDVVKVSPSGYLQAWLDPRSLPSGRLDAIGTNLQCQYANLNPRIKYKAYLDPSYEGMRKVCQALRRAAGHDRVLMHYNGHGVPRPTSGGELWVFNDNYTQYVPVSCIDIQNWLGSPCMCVWDCSSAGSLLRNFRNFADRRDQDTLVKLGGYPEGKSPFADCVQLAATAPDEDLPLCPELPADVFTSCLTTPIDMALRYFVLRNQLPTATTQEMVLQIPGDLKDRRTPLGELNWIFTSVTDTIAWTSFDSETFTKLFRSDVLVASVFRNFLLAERILKDYGCSPHTDPPLPPTNNHPLWSTWDAAVFDCLAQLPKMMDIISHLDSQADVESQSSGPQPLVYPYTPSSFFEQHLTAFEIWITHGGAKSMWKGHGAAQVEWEPSGDSHTVSHLVRRPPEQLPVVLQVLLAQRYRFRALSLLASFMDLGPWAVCITLTIGILPYMSKLLQASTGDLKALLSYMWARILAVDPSCHTDLLPDDGFRYFATVLSHQMAPSVHAAAAFVLSSLHRDLLNGHDALRGADILDISHRHLDDESHVIRQWSALLIAQLWAGNDDLRQLAANQEVPAKMISMLSDSAPDVRAAVLWALSTFLGAPASRTAAYPGGDGSGSMYHLDERSHLRMEIALATAATLACISEGSVMVRRELVVLLSCLVGEWLGHFTVAAWMYWEEDRRRSSSGIQLQDSTNVPDIVPQAFSEWLEAFGDDPSWQEENRVTLASFFQLFVAILELSVDPHEDVATSARAVLDDITQQLLASPFARLTTATSLDRPPGSHGPLETHNNAWKHPLHNPSSAFAVRSTDNLHLPLRHGLSSGLSNTLKRTASFANTLISRSGRSSPVFDDAGHIPNQARGSSHLRRTSAALLSPAMHDQLAVINSPALPPGHVQSTSDFICSDVMEALIEEDLERLRTRRKRSSQGSEHRTGRVETLSFPQGFTASTGCSFGVILACRTPTTLETPLPLRSQFYSYAVGQFTEPQMKPQEVDEPGSLEYNQQMWRKQEIEKTMIYDAFTDIAFDHSWDRDVISLHPKAHVQPTKMMFCPYDPILVVADETNTISLWDWKREHGDQCFNSFINGNPRGSRITALDLVNQGSSGGLILTGASDGIVRLFRNYDPPSSDPAIHMVSAFRGLGELIPVKRGGGLVLGWSQSRGTLLAGGDSRSIRLWDAYQELPRSDFATLSESPLTAVAHDPDSASTFIAGFADGSLRVFDSRLSEDGACVRTYRDHTRWVFVRWQTGGLKDLLSAGRDGSVRLWDIRGADGAVDTWEVFPGGMASFDVHERTAVFAATSALTATQWRLQHTVVHSLPPSRPRVLSRLTVPSALPVAPPVRGGEGVQSMASTSTSTVSFHPNEAVLALSEPTGHIRVVGCGRAHAKKARHVRAPSWDESAGAAGRRASFSIGADSP